MNLKTNEMIDWQRLYNVSDRIWKIAPWDFMYEDELFCVKLPDDQTLYFVSVMGSEGEHFAVTVYLGEEAYWKYVDLHDNGMMGDPGKVLEINQLQLSFDNHSFLDKEDLTVIKKLGRSYGDPKEFPMFRNFKDGYFPWYLNPEEVWILSVVLEQSEEMFLRIKKGFLLPDPLDHDYLVRYTELINDKLVWQEKTIYINPPSEVFEPYKADDKLLNRIKALPASNQLLEFDFSLLPKPISEKKSERPHYAAFALLVDHRQGMVIGTDVFGDKYNSSQRLSQAPGILLKLLSQQKIKPKGIDIIRPELYDMIGSVMDSLGIRLRLTDELPMIEEARESLFEFMD